MSKGLSDAFGGSGSFAGRLNTILFWCVELTETRRTLTLNSYNLPV